MKIILEGPDGAGKSTLGKELSMTMGIPVIHRERPKNDEEKRLMFIKYCELMTSNNSFILDRSWYSEMVYGPIMRDEHIISHEDSYRLEGMWVLNGGGMIIHCTDDINTLWNRLSLRGDDYVQDKDTLWKLKQGYEIILHKITHKVPVVRYELSKSMW